MPPEVLKVDPARLRVDDLRPAAQRLRDGGLVAFPTETVYGLGADARNAEAVGRIFVAKARPADNPLIVHVASLEQAGRVAAWITPLAVALADLFWPGPLTMVLEADPALPSITTGGLSTVAVRVPNHPVATALIDLAGVPVAAPSANRSGRPSPTQAQHVIDDLGDAVDVVVDGGPASVGLESTVVDARGDEPIVLREGAVTREELGMVGVEGGDLRASPGTRHRHYAPRCRVEVAAIGDGPARAAQLAGRFRVGLVAFAPAPPGVLELAVVVDAEDLGRRLYEAFREAETAGLDVVVVEAVREVGIGRAVMDRLRRAAAGSVAQEG